MTGSAVYEGWIRHRRFEPVEHAFRHRLFLLYLDLAELPEALDPLPLFSARRRAPARFAREDFMGDPRSSLEECARDTVEAAGGARPAGPVRSCSTGLRYFGHSFNPVSFYYCFAAGGERVEAVVADVQNIPWGSATPTSSCAVADRARPRRRTREGAARLTADGDEPDLRPPATEPGDRLAVHIDSRSRDGERASTPP